MVAIVAPLVSPAQAALPAGDSGRPFDDRQAWRITTTTLHTPLEELLFFQSLRTLGTDASSFAEISKILREDDFIQSSAGYDPERLSPGNLQQLYLRLLKEEVRSASRAAGSPNRETENGNSRKRKLSTPPLQSIDEAAEHSHLLPRLINRLYARYQDHIIEAIREEEKTYNILQQSIKDIETGKLDAQLEAEEAARKEAHDAQSINNLLSPVQDERNDAPADRRMSGVQQGSDTAVPAPEAAQSSEKNAHNGWVEGNTSTTPQGESVPLQENAHNQQTPRHPPATAISSLLSPRTQAQPLPSPSYPTLPPPETFAKPPTPRGPQSASPQLSQRGTPQPERGSGSPIILPPPPGMLRPPGPPGPPLEHHPEMANPPYRPNANMPSPQQAQLPNLPPHPQPPRGFVQRPYSYPYDTPGGYPPYTPYGQPAIPPFNTPGYPNIPAQSPSPMQGYPTNARPMMPPQYQNQMAYGGYHGYQGQMTPQPARASSTPHAHQFGGQSTPVPPSTGSRRVHGLPPLNTTTSSTKWKSGSRSGRDAQRSPVPPPHSPYLPSSPEVSPAEDIEMKLPDSAPSQKKRPGKSNETATRGGKAPARGSGRRGRWAGHTPRGRGGRVAVSPSSSVRPGSKGNRTRSQSVASQTDDRKVKGEPTTPLPTTDDTSAMSTPGSTAHPSRHRRQNTLRGPPDLAPLSVRAGLKRKRASTLEGIATPEQPTTPRFLNPPTRPGYILASRNFPRIVAPLMHDINSHKLASMFAKPITDRDAPGYHGLIYRPQDLKSIRGAISAGSRAVAAATAEATSTPAAGPPNTPGESSGPGASNPATPLTSSHAPSSTSSKTATVWVERTADVVPPKGIVNSTQLEKEICRMFANAVMFNPDPKRGFGKMLQPGKGSGQRRAKRRASNDSAWSRHVVVDGKDGTGRAGGADESDSEGERGHYEYDDGGAFVRDAREMFAGVERSLTEWRAAERVSSAAAAAAAASAASAAAVPNPSPRLGRSIGPSPFMGNIPPDPVEAEGNAGDGKIEEAVEGGRKRGGRA